MPSHSLFTLLTSSPLSTLLPKENEWIPTNHSDSRGSDQSRRSIPSVTHSTPDLSFRPILLTRNHFTDSIKNRRSLLLNPRKFNPSYPFTPSFIPKPTSNPSAIPRFHVSSLQLSSILLFLSISYWIMERLQHGVLQNIAKFLSLRNKAFPNQLIL